MAEMKTKPIVRRFSVRGLHGYKDVDLTFEGPVRIVIAENGTGKTTFLALLQAFLRADFAKLATYPFDAIECEVSGCKDSLVLQRDDVSEGDQVSSETMQELAEAAEMDPPSLLRVIAQAQLDDPGDIHAYAMLQKIYYDTPYSLEEIFEIFQRIKGSLESTGTDAAKHVREQLKAVTEQARVLYLPTYRRIEVPSNTIGFEQFQQRLRRTTRGLRPGSVRDSINAIVDIQFGLRDVGNRLTEIVSEIQRQSNLGYRSISADIIDELLSGLLPEKAPERTALPDIDTLARFLSRIETRRSAEARLDSLRALYTTGKIDEENNATLRYFLTKLSAVLDQTKELEANIEAFAEKANVYLEQSSDEKRLRYDQNAMKVVVQNSWTDREIKLDDLSSGEKQVVSLLASLYLYPDKKLVLIDEPELSLSIDWQRRLLPDVLAAPACAQLLAITHSPFIFENELDPFAGPLVITRRAAK